MSIIYKNDECWYISHSKYIESIYSNVNSNSQLNYKLKNNLFAIDSPYLRSNQNIEKRKKCLEEDKIRGILSDDVKLVIETFKKFKQTCTVFFKNESNDTSNNSKAQEEAEKSYSLTSKNHILNTNGGNLNSYPITHTIAETEYLFPAKSTFFCKDINLLNEWFNKEREKFDLIVLDPPWWNKYIRRKKRKASEHSYQMMYNEDLENITIDKLLSENGFVIVWCTNSKNHEQAIINDFFPKWNVVFIAKWFWLKITTMGEPVCDFSEPPGKQPFELIIIGCRKNCVPNIHLNNRLVVSVPSALHSHKPPLIKIIEPFLVKDPKCLEIFARYLLPNWTSWGLEVCRLQNLNLYEKVCQ